MDTQQNEMIYKENSYVINITSYKVTFKGVYK